MLAMFWYILALVKWLSVLFWFCLISPPWKSFNRKSRDYLCGVWQHKVRNSSPYTELTGQLSCKTTKLKGDHHNLEVLNIDFWWPYTHLCGPLCQSERMQMYWKNSLRLRCNFSPKHVFISCVHPRLVQQLPTFKMVMYICVSWRRGLSSQLSRIRTKGLVDIHACLTRFTLA